MTVLYDKTLVTDADYSCFSCGLGSCAKLPVSEGERTPWWTWAAAAVVMIGLSVAVSYGINKLQSSSNQPPTIEQVSPLEQTLQK